MQSCDCLGLVMGAMIGGTVPGLLFLVSRRWVHGFSCNVRGAVGFVVVVSRGASATLRIAHSPSEVGVSLTLRSCTVASLLTDAYIFWSIFALAGFSNCLLLRVVHCIPQWHDVRV